MVMAVSLNHPCVPTAADIRRAAVELLARREYSVQELRSRLQKKFLYLLQSGERGDLPLLQASIDEQLMLLAAENLQSDLRFVESFINRKKNLGHGPQRIRYELRQLAIEDALIEQCLDPCDEQWLILARQVYRKKFGSQKASSYQERAKRMRFMAQRGFESWMFAEDGRQD